MSTTTIVIALVMSAVFVAAVTLRAKPRFDRITARREVVGDVEMPRSAWVRLIVIAIAGSVACALVPVVWRTDAGLLVAVAAVCVMYGVILRLSLHDAEAAQARRAGQSQR